VALTLLASFLYVLVGAISAGVWAMTSGATGEGDPIETNNEIALIALPYLIMAACAFLVSRLILLLNSKIVWFTATAFWVANIIFWARLVLRWGNFAEPDLLQLHLTILVVPALYSLSCIGYFMTPHVKKRFNL